MTDQRKESKGCVICGELDAAEKGALVEIKTARLGLVLRAHEECIDALYLLLSSRKKKVAAIEPAKKSCQELIEGFYLEGWFAVPRRLADVLQRIRAGGFNFPKPTVANGLRAMTRGDLLVRTGKKGDYGYIQKRPPEVA